MASALSKIETETYTEEDYYSLGEDIRAELINGQFYYMAAPSRIHQEILSELHTIINNYIKSKGGACKIYPAPFAVKLFYDKSNIVEPDISVICDRDKLTNKGCLGAPDWIIEIVSPSDPKHDYITKLNLYNNAGVREYWIVDPMYNRVYVYCLETDNFYVNNYFFHDTIKVCIFEDLHIDFSKLDIEIE